MILPTVGKNICPHFKHARKGAENVRRFGQTLRLAAAEDNSSLPSDEEKEAIPEGYQLPEVWEAPSPEKMGGRFGAMNLPTAGARSEEDLPRGKHELQLYSLATPNGQKVILLIDT